MQDGGAHGVGVHVEVQGLDGRHVQLDGDVRRSLRVHLAMIKRGKEDDDARKKEGSDADGTETIRWGRNENTMKNNWDKGSAHRTN